MTSTYKQNRNDNVGEKSFFTSRFLEKVFRKKTGSIQGGYRFENSLYPCVLYQKKVKNELRIDQKSS